MNRRVSIFVLFVSIIWLIASSDNACAATRTASVAGNWNATATWGGSPVPTSSDDVIINSGITVTVSATGAVCNSITVNAPAAANGITFSGAYTLTVTGAITMTIPTSTFSSTIAVNTGTLSAASIAIPGNNTSTGNCIVSVSTGTITVSGNITFSGTAARAQLTFTGAGTLNIGGNLGSGGTFTKSTGTVNFNGTSAQTFAGYNYNIVKVNNTAGVTPLAAPTITTLTLADVTAGSVFNDGGYTITTATTLNLNSGTYYCTTATFPWGILNYGTGTVNYAGGNQTIESINHYNLSTSGSGTKTIALGVMYIYGNLSIGANTTLTESNSDYYFEGNFTNNGTYISGTGVHRFRGTTPGGNTIDGTGDITFNGLFNFYQNDNISYTFNGSGTLTAAGAYMYLGYSGTSFTNNGKMVLSSSTYLTLDGTNNVFTNNGTLTTSISNSIRGAPAGSTFINGANATLNLNGGGGSSITTFTATATGNTVNYNYAGAETVRPTTFYNLTLKNSGAKTTTSVTVNNILSMEGTATASAAPTYGANATLQYNTATARTAGPEWTSTFARTGGVIIANTGTITMNNAKTISYGLAINSGASLNLGTYTSSAGTLTFGGASQASGSWGGTASSATNKNSTYFGTTATGILNVTTGCGTAGTWLGTTSTDWNTATNWCGGVPTASTNVTIPSAPANQPHIGAAGGLCNNITISSGATLTMDGAYSLTVSGDWTNNGGTFTPSTSTVTFNGTGAQAINGTLAAKTFNNVVIAKTAGTTLSFGGSTTSITLNNLTETTGNFTAPATLTINGSATLTVGTFTAGANTNIAGNWTNNGATFTHSSGTVTFNGSNAANINGSAATSFYNLTINKNAASTTVTNPSTGQAFSVGNNLTVTQGNLVLQATNANYTVTNDLTVSANGTLTHSVSWDSSGKLLRVDGNLSIDGTFTYTVRSHLQMGGANKTIRTGSSALSILTLAHTSGTITASGTVTVNDNFWASFMTAGGTFATSSYTVNANAGLFNAGGTVNINGGALNVTSGFLVGGAGSNGNVTFSSGTLTTDYLIIGDGTNTGAFSQSGGTANIGNLTLSGAGNSYTCTNSPTINITGDWTNNGGTFTPASSTVTFNGSSAQALGGSSGTTFNNLTINNSAGVTLGANETVSNILTLTSGKVATTASYYLAVTNTSSGAVTGYSSSSYVNGSLQWSLATGGSSLFPVGDASNYRPFELNSITCSSPVVRVTMSSTGASTVDATMSSVDPRNWYAQLVSGSFTSATVRITESGLGSTNLVASSSAQAGQYTNRGGNSIGSTITSNAGISYTGSTYFAVGDLLPPVLTVVKSASKSSVVTGDTVTYSITITNTGSGTATNVIATDPLPPYTTYVSNSTRLNGITVAGDGSALPLIAGLLVDDNGSRTAGAVATGILPPHSGSAGVATITFQVTIN